MAGEFLDNLGELPDDLELDRAGAHAPMFGRQPVKPAAARPGQPARRPVPGGGATVNRVNLAPIPFETVEGSRQFLAANLSRRFLAIQNHDSIADLWLNFGTAAAENVGFKIAAGAYWWWDAQGVPVGAVSVYAAAAGYRFTLAEG